MTPKKITGQNIEQERNGERKDKWSDWLTRRRDADSDKIRDMSKSAFEGIRDRVLDEAGVQPGHVVLDVGTGTGLIAFGALDRVGKEGRVIFSDISTDCLDQCRGMVEEMGLGAQCEFIVSGAEDLSAIADESVDIVTTRSVIIYVEEKQRAFDEFYRVLRPGGSLSMFEPINSFAYEKKDDLLKSLIVNRQSLIVNRQLRPLRCSD